MNADRKDEIQKALDSAAEQIRSMLGKNSHLRTIPELHFVFDDSEVKAAKAMEELATSCNGCRKTSSGEN